MAELTPDQRGDLAWLNGYRMRANGKPRPTTPATTADGWDDLDAILKLIEQALNPKPPTGGTSLDGGGGYGKPA